MRLQFFGKEFACIFVELAGDRGEEMQSDPLSTCF